MSYALQRSDVMLDDAGHSAIDAVVHLAVLAAVDELVKFFHQNLELSTGVDDNNDAHGVTRNADRVEDESRDHLTRVYYLVERTVVDERHSEMARHGERSRRRGFGPVLV